MTRRPDPETPGGSIFLQTAWQLCAPSGRILSCGIYQTDCRLEIRVGYGDDLLYSKRLISIDTARLEAERLRQAVLAKGGCSDR